MADTRDYKRMILDAILRDIQGLDQEQLAEYIFGKIKASGDQALQKGIYHGGRIEREALIKILQDRG